MKKSATSISFFLLRGPRRGTRTSSAPLAESAYNDFFPVVPRKKRFKSPACVRRMSRTFARVVEWNPATISTCSRSATRRIDNSRSKRRSRSCTTRALRLFPSMEHLVRFLEIGRLPSRDVAFNVGADFSSRVAGAINEIGRVHRWQANRRHPHLVPPVGAGLHDV